MKQYILRSPETDRALVTVPEHAYGYGPSPISVAVTNGASVFLGLAPTANAFSPAMYLVTNGEASGFLLSKSGLYLINVHVQWTFSTPGAITRRIGWGGAGVVQNSELFSSTVGADHTDVAQWLALCNEGDFISAWVENTDGGVGTVVNPSLLSIVCLNA